MAEIGGTATENAATVRHKLLPRLHLKQAAAFVLIVEKQHDLTWIEYLTTFFVTRRKIEVDQRYDRLDTKTCVVSD